MHFPTWVDLKGEDSVPETVHHVVVRVDPRTDNSWTSLRRHVQTDGVHAKDGVRPGNNTPGECVGVAIETPSSEIGFVIEVFGNKVPYLILFKSEVSRFLSLTFVL